MINKSAYISMKVLNMNKQGKRRTYSRTEVGVMWFQSLWKVFFPFFMFCVCVKESEVSPSKLSTTFLWFGADFPTAFTSKIFKQFKRNDTLAFFFKI